MSEKILQYNVVVVGGGAAGLAAAVCCAKKTDGKIKIAVIEKENKIGKKLLATGNGRCNLTNTDLSEKHYNFDSRAFVKSIISKYGSEKLMLFFRSIGLICKADSSGRVYPYSAQASSVLNVLTMNIEYYNVDVYCETEINQIEYFSNGYRLKSKDKIFAAEKVILASGGKVQPALGSGGASYKFAEDLGLECTEIFPSLAPIPCGDKYLPLLKGVRTPARVALKADGNILHEEFGELQFNEKNISGICVFQLSRMVNEFFAARSINGVKYKKIVVTADLMPDYSQEEITKILLARKKLFSQTDIKELFTGILNQKLGNYLLKKLSICSHERKMLTLTEEEAERLANAVKNCEFYPVGMSEYQSAQVTAGGIKLSEIDRTMRSIKHKNLYIIGEALNVDGMCGGYNLHWAFSGGIIAGNAAADSYKAKKKR